MIRRIDSSLSYLTDQHAEIAASFSIAAGLAVLTGAIGRYSLVVAVLSLWLSAAATAHGTARRPGKWRAVCAGVSAATATVLASGGFAVGTLAVWPCVLVQLAVGGCVAVEAALILLLLGTSLAVAGTLRMSAALESMLQADCAWFASLLVLFVLLVTAFRGICVSVLSMALLLGLIVVGIAGPAPNTMAAILALLLTSRLTVHVLCRGSIRAPAVLGIAIMAIAVWVPYGEWALRRGPEATAIVLPSREELGGTVFEHTALALRERFPDIQIWEDLGAWQDPTTVLFPDVTTESWGERWWKDAVLRAERTRSRMIMFGEHTNLNDFLRRLRAVRDTYSLTFMDATTLPRPNRDLGGRVWSIGPIPIPPGVALNRGAPIKGGLVRTRPFVVGRDWFADNPGWRSESARLGDYRATQHDWLADVMLGAHSVSESRASALTAIADNSSLVDFNAIVQPSEVFNALTQEPTNLARWDVALCLVSIAGWLASVGRVGLSSLGVGTALLVLVASSLGGERFDHAEAPIYEPSGSGHGYSDSGSARFRLWWLGRTEPQSRPLLVIGTWIDLKSACEAYPQRNIMFVGLPQDGEACGVVAENVFRSGTIRVGHNGGTVRVRDGGWAGLIPSRASQLDVAIGDESEAFAGTWMEAGRWVSFWFDIGALSPEAHASAEYEAAFLKLVPTRLSLVSRRR